MRRKRDEMSGSWGAVAVFPAAPPHSHLVKKIKFELGNISLE